MRRRELLTAGLAAAGLGALPAMAADFTQRVRPGGVGWPDAEAWNRLRQSVGGRLVKPVGLADSCQSDAKSAACTDLLKNLANPYYIGDQPGGTQVSGWLDAWTPSLSAYAVAAAQTSDVVAAVRFARERNLRLAVKGGGHSYQGTSNAPDSLLIWTRAMNAIVVHDAFTPAGCQTSPVPAVSIGAGAMWADAYGEVTTKAGRYVQGGGCATVGVAGLVQSGGFGSFSKQYGTAASSLIEAEVVTADGRVRVVNAAHDPDLLWALKGGGGGSFGVVTRLTLRTHSLADQAGGMDLRIKASSDAAFARLLGRFVEVYAQNLCNPHWGESLQLTPDNALKVNMVFQGLSAAQAKAAWAPLIAFAAAAPAEFTVEGPRASTQPMRLWWNFAAEREMKLPYEIFDNRPGAPAQHAWWSGDQEQVSAFLYGYDSLWLPASLLRTAGERARLAQGLYDATRHFEVGLHFNKGLAGGSPEAIAASAATATNPAVLGAFALAIIATGGLPDYPGYPKRNLTKARAEAMAIAAATAALRPLAPAGGSYVSESNYFNADWRQAFWGPNYRRLAAVKAKYDPNGLFTVHHGVGSEAWSGDGFTRSG